MRIHWLVLEECFEDEKGFISGKYYVFWDLGIFNVCIYNHLQRICYIKETVDSAENCWSEDKDCFFQLRGFFIVVFLFVSVKPVQHESGMTVSLVSKGAVAFVTRWSMCARVREKIYREYAPEIHSVGPQCGLLPSQEVR